MNRKRKWMSMVTVMVMLISLLAGCAKNSSVSGKNQEGSAETQQTSATTKDTLVVATTSEAPTMSPYSHNATAGSYMNLLTYDTLFRSDMDLNPQPSLVESYENVSETEWLFHLKQGVKFHDGSEMKAEDVKASLEYAKTFPEVSQYNKSIASVEVMDEYSFKITTDGPSAVLLNNLTHHGNAIVPKALIESGNDFNKNPIGSGPFVFKKWTLGDSIEFEGFADYFDGAPSIKKMTWKIIPEGSSRTIALEAGEVDMVIEVEAMDAQRIDENNDLKLLKTPSTALNWMVLNNEKPGLDNEKVRHAINCAINKESVVTVALNGMGTVADGMGASMLAGYSDENTETYDVEKAKKYLQESGVDPKTLELSIVCSNDTKKRAAEVIQANLADIGVHAEIESMDLATYLSATVEGNFTACIGGYTATDLVSHVMGVFHSSSINASNQARFKNAEVDVMIDQAAATVDPDTRNELMKKLMAKINRCLPNVALYTSDTLRAYNAGLAGVEVNAGGTMYMEKISWKS